LARLCSRWSRAAPIRRALPLARGSRGWRSRGPELATRSLTVPRDQRLAGRGGRTDPRRDVHRHAGQFVADPLALDGVDADPQLERQCAYELVQLLGRSRSRPRGPGACTWSRHRTVWNDSAAVVLDAVADQAVAFDGEPAPCVVPPISEMSLVEPTTSSNITVAIRRSDRGAAWPLTSSTLCSQNRIEGLAPGHTRLARPQDDKLARREQLGSVPAHGLGHRIGRVVQDAHRALHLSGDPRQHRSESRRRCTPSPLPGWPRSARAGRLGDRCSSRRSPAPSDRS